MFEHQVAQAAFGIDGGLAAFFFVGDVDEEFYNPSVLTFGDGVGDRVDQDFTIAQQGFVVDGVVQVAGEAGIIPEQQGFGAVFGLPG
jgi:hypothetical protein